MEYLLICLFWPLLTTKLDCCGVATEHYKRKPITLNRGNQEASEGSPHYFNFFLLPLPQQGIAGRRLKLRELWFWLENKEKQGAEVLGGNQRREV
jgi:hypothetical protein